MSWNDQYQRVLRSLQRLHDRKNKTEEYYTDDIFHFFMDCWHLKDWVKKDNELAGFAQKAIVKDAEASEILQFARALADRSKHFELRKGRKQDARTVGNWHISTGDDTRFLDFTVAEVSNDGKEGREWEVIDFANQAVKEWGRILTKHGLDAPGTDCG